MNAALERALNSLHGLSVGDAIGERFFSVDEDWVRSQLEARRLPEPQWRYTDDTEMALSVVAMLRDYGHIHQDRLATAFAVRYNPRRGYGAGAHQLLEAIGRSETGSWRYLARAMFAGRGSYGNGTAMRVAPLGAYFADDFEQAATQARDSAQVTHTHHEGIAGAIAVAIASAWMHGDQPWEREAYFASILEYTPESEVRTGILKAQRLGTGLSGSEAACELGSGERITAQGLAKNNIDKLECICAALARSE